jgi:hypothetical protein
LPLLWLLLLLLLLLLPLLLRLRLPLLLLVLAVILSEAKDPRILLLFPQISPLRSNHESIVKLGAIFAETENPH